MAFMMAAFFRAALFCELGSVATTLQEKMGLRSSGCCLEIDYIICLSLTIAQFESQLLFVSKIILSMLFAIQ